MLPLALAMDRSRNPQAVWGSSQLCTSPPPDEAAPTLPSSIPEEREQPPGQNACGHEVARRRTLAEETWVKHLFLNFAGRGSGRSHSSSIGFRRSTRNYGGSSTAL